MDFSKRMTLLQPIVESYPYARLVDETSRTGYQLFSVYSNDPLHPAKLASAPIPDVAWARAKRIINTQSETFMKNIGLSN